MKRFASWLLPLRCIFCRHGRGQRNQPRSRCRPFLDTLENRIVPAVPMLLPSQVATAYGVNQIMFGSTPGTGAGQTIAVIDGGDDSALVDSTSPSFSTSDLAVFDAATGLPDPPSFRVVGETGGARPTYSPVSIMTLSESSSSVVTVMTSSPPGLVQNEEVNISGVTDTSYDGGPFQISTVTSTGFTYTDNSSFGLTPSTGGTATPVNPIGSGKETALDVEWAHAMAPAANIVLIEMTAGIVKADVVNAVSMAVPSVNASVVSMSFGFAEFSGENGTSATAFDDGLFQQSGVTFLACTLDRGEPAVYPAASPNVVAVGATNLNLNPDNSYLSELGWSNPPLITSATESGHVVTIHTATATGLAVGNEITISGVGVSGYNGVGTFTVASVSSPTSFTYIDSNTGLMPSSGGKVFGTVVDTGNFGGSGGGISTEEMSQPAYQQGTVTKVTQSTTERTTPDVSFVGGSATPVEIYDSLDGGFTYAGGTSLATPCWAGLVAIMDQGLALHGKPALNSSAAGFPGQITLQTALYDLPMSFFHDITSGYNGSNAGPGYDLVTGIGTPKANLLVPEIAGDNLGLLVLDPTGKGALTVSGDGPVTVNNDGAVVVNSSNAHAVILSDENGVIASDIDITGGTKTSGGGMFSSPVDQVPPTPDPIALPLPAAPSPTFPAVDYSGSSMLTLMPGTYDGGIKDQGSGNIVLKGGVYYLKGGGLEVLGSGSISGTGVLIINAPTDSGDQIKLTSKGDLTLNPPSPASLPATYSAYAGIAIFQAPSSSAPIHISGDGSLIMAGILYAPAAPLHILGNGGLFDNTALGAPLAEVIVFDVNLSGDGGLTINADAPATNPPLITPAGGAAQVSFISFSTSVNPSVPRQPVSFKAVITSTSGAPPGQVDFFDATTDIDLGSAPLIAGVATITASALTSLGDQTITATYISSSPNFAPPSAPDSLLQHVKSVVIEGSALYVGGNPNSSKINVSESGGTITVKLHDGTPNFNTPVAPLTSLVVYGQGTGDQIIVSSNVMLPAILYAGGYQSRVQGGGGPTVEIGGSRGSTLIGGSGRSILIAGTGGGNLQSGAGGSILIGGYTDSDNNLTALTAALTEWASADSYATRIASAALAIFNAGTVHSDGFADTLKGASGTAALDWFFASTLDHVTNKNSSETEVAIT